MRVAFLWLLGLVLCTPLVALSQSGKPIPPGVRTAERLPPPAGQPRKVSGQRPGADRGQLKHDADELAKLAQLIPLEIERVQKGELPKDLNEQLKRIEKLSKQLRRGLSR